MHGVLGQHGQGRPHSQVHRRQHAVRDAELQPRPRRLQSLPGRPRWRRPLCDAVRPAGARLQRHEDPGERLVPDFR